MQLTYDVISMIISIPFWQGKNKTKAQRGWVTHLRSHS